MQTATHTRNTRKPATVNNAPIVPVAESNGDTSAEKTEPLAVRYLADGSDAALIGARTDRLATLTASANAATAAVKAYAKQAIAVGHSGAMVTIGAEDSQAVTLATASDKAAAMLQAAQVKAIADCQIESATVENAFCTVVEFSRGNGDAAIAQRAIKLCRLASLAGVKAPCLRRIAQLVASDTGKDTKAIARAFAKLAG